MSFPIPLPDHFLALAAHWAIVPTDIDEFHTHGHGHGGQKINKSTNCVELTHRPTGTTVRMQHHRGLLKNRIEGYVLLIQKIAAHKAMEEHEEHERLYREQHPEGWQRSKTGKRRTMDEKRHNADRKKERAEAPPSSISGDDAMH